MRKAAHPIPNSLPSLPCGCAALRRAARAVTQLYDDALRPVDLRVTQFTILQVLDKVGSIAQGDLGHVLAMDSTTLSRTLRLMDKNGWIAGVPGEDRRERQFSLTRKGRTQMERALPLWESVQKRLQKSLGQSKWTQLVTVLDEEGLQIIERNADTILQEVGIEQAHGTPGRREVREGVDVGNLDVVHHEQVLERAAAADDDVVAEVVAANHHARQALHVARHVLQGRRALEDLARLH